MTEFAPYNPNEAAIAGNNEIRARYTEAYKVAEADQNLAEAYQASSSNVNMHTDVHPDALTDNLHQETDKATDKAFNSRVVLRVLNKWPKITTHKIKMRLWRMQSTRT